MVLTVVELGESHRAALGELERGQVQGWTERGCRGGRIEGDDWAVRGAEQQET
jgi:hypothetical protein